MKKDTTPLRWLWGKMKGYRALFFCAMGLTVVYNILQLTVPLFTQNIVDLFLTGEQAAYNLQNNVQLLLWLVAGMVGVTFLRTVIVYFACMGFEEVSQKTLYRVRNELFAKIQHQDMRFYDQYRTGDLMTRLTGDLDAVRHMVAWVVRMLVECFTLFMAAAVYFFYLNVKVAACILIVSPFILLVTLAFKKQVEPMHTNLREKLAQMNTAAQENISGNRVVKAFAREDYEINKFHERSAAYSKANKQTVLTWLRFYPVIEICADALPVILLVVGGLSMMDGNLTSGQYVAFSCLIWAIANPMRNLGNILNEFQRFIAACTKVMELEASEPQIVDREDAIDHPERFKGKIEFQNVSFSYEGKRVLADVSFTVQPGMTVAIMGETGSGKTSLIQLIPRFYDPEEGRVLVDDVDVRELKLTQLRKNIGLATQDILLYSDTIDGNIAYGNSAMSVETVQKYAEYAAASTFIDQLPQKYDTVVGERGVGLSGGQKQRISLARALAIEPAVLILDDTTSAVDMETEKFIQEHLRKLHFPCTKIIIAQRISSTKDADLILILENGRITEMGTHEELIGKKGYYYQVVQLQNGGADIG
jgi:ATP-binding cassette subfamily B protein